jgi:hypothetical protein
MLPPRIPRKSDKAERGKRSPAHRQWVREHACCSCGSIVAIECAHVRTAANSGMGIKPSDAFTISLCKECHHMAHTMGDDALCLDMMGLAREFYFKSPHRSKLDNPYA